MTILEPKVSIALKNARLPQGQSRFSVPGSKLPVNSQARIANWLVTSGHPDGDQLIRNVPESFNGWWTIAESPENGRTLWGPYVAQDPQDLDNAVVVCGSTCWPLSNFTNWSVVADEDGGYGIEWQSKDDSGVEYFSLPIRLAKEVKTSLKELRQALPNNISKLLAKAVIYYPKLFSLPIGQYQVVGTFEYSGFKGPAHGLTIDHGAYTQNYQGNRETESILSLSPTITPESPATLTVMSHGTTSQGWPMAVVRLVCRFDDVSPDDFDFDYEPVQPMLAGAPDEIVVDFDTETQVPGVQMVDPEEPKMKGRRRSR